jgi:hypothetical protein
MLCFFTVSRLARNPDLNFEIGSKKKWGVLGKQNAYFPLSRAEHRRCERKKARGLSERSEFPRALAAATRRCRKHRAGRQGARRSETRSNRQIVSTRANLATPHGGTRRRFIARFGGAQGKAGHGRFLLIQNNSPDRRNLSGFYTEKNGFRSKPKINQRNHLPSCRPTHCHSI